MKPISEITNVELKEMYPYVVVSTYSFDDNAGVYPCTSYDKAKAVLKAIFDSEVALDIEGKNEFETEFSEEGDIAKIINYRANGEVDTTIYRVVETGCDGSQFLDE